MSESEIDKDEQEAMDACLKALLQFRNHGTAADVMGAIDQLIHVRLAQFAEAMADRVEEKLGARP
jgi:hypothetical protein